MPASAAPPDERPAHRATPRARSGPSRCGPRRRGRRSRASASKRKLALQRTHGLGVRPAAYSETNSSTTTRWKPSRRSRPRCGTPRAWHAERAARTDCGEQHARSESGAAGSIQSRSVTPTAWAPDSTALRSATALSTPPDIATATRPGSIASGAPTSTAGRDLRHRAHQPPPACTAGGIVARPSTASDRAPDGGGAEQVRPSARSHSTAAAAVECGHPKRDAAPPDAAFGDLELDADVRRRSWCLPASPSMPPGPISPARSAQSACWMTASEYMRGIVGEAREC